jgi:serine/threonine-protein kinase
MAQLMFKIANEACPDIRTVNPQVPAGVVAVIERALNKDITQRYQTGDAMARDLRASLQQAPRQEQGPAQHPDIDILL